MNAINSPKSKLLDNNWFKKTFFLFNKFRQGCHFDNFKIMFSCKILVNAQKEKQFTFFKKFVSSLVFRL